MYTYIFVCVCVYVCMCVCVYTGLKGGYELRRRPLSLPCTYVYVCMYVYMYICIYVYICMYMYISIYLHIHIHYRKRHTNWARTRTRSRGARPRYLLPRHCLWLFFFPHISKSQWTESVYDPVHMRRRMHACHMSRPLPWPCTYAEEDACMSYEPPASLTLYICGGGCMHVIWAARFPDPVHVRRRMHACHMRRRMHACCL